MKTDTVSRSGKDVKVIGQAMVTVSDIMTVLATTDYTANDVVSDGAIGSLDITGLGPGGSGTIRKALLTNENTQAAHSIRTYLYNSTGITSVLTDNAANTGPTLADVLAGYALGWIDFPAFTTKGTGPTQALVVPGRGNVPLSFQCSEGSTTLYYIHITLDTFTNEVANARYILSLDIQKD